MIFTQQDYIKIKEALLKMSIKDTQFDSAETPIKRNDLIKEQKSTIKEQKQEINRLNDVIDILNRNIVEIFKKYLKQNGIPIK